MKIQKTRIRKIDGIISAFTESPVIYVAFHPITEVQKELIRRAGFKDVTAINEKILPREISSVSRFNSRGKDKVLKHLPKEPFSWWRWLTDWHGDDHYVEISGMRYPREPIPAPGQELTLVEQEGILTVLSDALTNNPSNHGLILHVVNLFLSLFGECEILNSDMSPLLDETKIKRVNWRILPEGRLTWNRVKEYANEMETNKPSRKKEQEFCFQIIEGHEPDEIYAGNGGFEGYLVFVFHDLNLSIMENFRYGNATYVFNANWQAVSKLTKAQILTEHLHDKRIVHNNSWKREVEALLGGI